MGRKGRERRERIEAGQEKSIAEMNRGMSVVERAEVNYLVENREDTKRALFDKVQSQSTSKQIRILAEALHSRSLTHSKLRRTLIKNAHKEMQKGIKRLAKENKIPTADLLLMEYDKDAKLRSLANEVGLDRDWFVATATEEIGKYTTLQEK